MHSVANLATVQTPLANVSLQKSAQTLFSLRESLVLTIIREEQSLIQLNTDISCLLL